MNFDEKLNNKDGSSEIEAKEAAVIKDNIKNENNNEKPQLSKCDDEKLLSSENKDLEVYKESAPSSDSDDILFNTGEYYHDHENYPSHITFKHPFMNIISLICGLLSSLFCVCASPAPFLKYLPSLWLILSAFFSILGIGLFIFDLIKSKTVNGLSVAGLILSILGAVLSAIMAFIIFASLIIKIIFWIIGLFSGTTLTIGGILAILLPFI